MQFRNKEDIEMAQVSILNIMTSKLVLILTRTPQCEGVRYTEVPQHAKTREYKILPTLLITIESTKTSAHNRVAWGSV